MASIETDPSNRLRIKFRIPGQETAIREPLRLDDTKENRRLARRILNEVERELAARDFEALRRRFPDSPRVYESLGNTGRYITPKVSEFCRTWLAEMTGQRDSTIANYQSIVTRWIDPSPIAGRRLDTLTPQDGVEFASFLRAKQEPTNTLRNKVLDQLGRIFKRARQLGLMRPEQNPLIGLNRFEDHGEQDETALGAWTVEERERLIAAAYAIAEWQGAVVETAFFTGLRRGELFGLKWSDLDFERREIRIRRSVGQSYDRLAGGLGGGGVGLADLHSQRSSDDARDAGEQTGSAGEGTLAGQTSRAPKTAGAVASIEMLPRVRTALLAQRQRVGLSSLWVFPSSTGGPQQVINFVNRLWPKIVSSANVQFRPFKQTRHTFAVLALEAGGEGQLLWVQRMLRHTTTQMLINHYLKHAKPVAPGAGFVDRFEAQA